MGTKGTPAIRKQAEEALHALSARQEAILAAVPDILMEVNNDKMYTWANPAGIEFFGEDVIGKEAAFYFEGVQDTYGQVKPLFNGSEDVIYVESWQRRKDGEKRLLGWHCRVLKDTDGNVVGALSSAHDITERKQVEAALAWEQYLLRTLLDNLPDRIYFKDRDSRFTRVSKSQVEMFGLNDSAEALGKTDFDFFTEAHARPAFEAEQNIMATGQPVVGLEEKETWSDGRLTWVNTTKMPLQDQAGNIIGTFGISSDITERKRAEEAQKQSELLFRALFELSPDAVVLIDPHDPNVSWPIVDCNAVACLMNGYRRDELIGHSIDIVNANPYIQTEKIAYLKKLREAGNLKYEVFHRHKSGAVFPVEISTTIIKIGERELVIGIDRDITERKQAEAELQASHTAEKNFSERLTILSETTTELSKAESIDALCRRAVELGRERLDFDRLSIWFLAEDNITMMGTFGVDTEGRITDERKERLPIGLDYPNMAVFQGQTPLLRLDDTPLALMGQVVGRGMHVSAGIWDGKNVIGFISVDNLLRQRPFSDRDCEIIRLYATAVGHLISLKRADETLRTSEERYRMLAENMSDTVWLMDLNLKITYISPSVTKLRGYTLEELNALPLDQQMTPESFARAVKLFTTELAPERLAQGDLPISATLELEFYKKDGTAFWSENTFSLIRNPQGQPLAILNSGRDITERKKAQEALENSEKRFRALIENNTDAIFLVDPRGMILYESPAYARMMGREYGQRLGRSSFEHIHPEDRESIAGILNELVQYPGRIGQATFRNQHKDGSWRWIEATATNLLGESAVQAIVVNMHDATERKQAEAALAKTERIYRQAITETGGVPYHNDYGSDNYLFLGEGFESLTGYPPAEMTVTLLTSRLRQIESYGKYKDLPHPERVRLARQGKIKEWREDYLFERKDGSLVWLADHAVPVYDSDGRSVGSLGILMDITERKQAEESIRRQLAELEVLYETGLSINSLLEPKEIGQKVTEVLAEKLSWRHAAVRLYNPETQRVELLVFNRPGLSAQELQTETRRLNRIIAKPGEGFSGWVIQHGQPVRCGNVNDDPRYIKTFKGVQSGLYVPMQVGERTIGVIGVESEQADAFTEADERLLKTLAAQASIAIENARLLAETLHHVEELGALANVSSALRTALTRPEIVSVILDQLMTGLFPTDDARLVAHDPVTGDNIVEEARGKWAKWVGMRLEPSEGLSGLVAETLLPYQSNDILQEELATKGKMLKQPEAVAGMPLLVQGQFIGSLWVGRTRKKKGENPVPFTPDEMRLLSSVADMAANALHRATLHEQAVRHAEELLAVNTMGRVLAETLDLNQIYEELDEIVWQLLNDISLVAIALYDADKKQITCVRFNTEDGLVETATLPPVPLEPPGVGTQSEAVHTRQPVIINNLRERLKKVSFKMDVGVDDGRVTQSGLYVPMLAHGRVIGVMQAQSYTLNRFSQSDADLLSLVANTAAVDIENARLFAETQKRLHNLSALHTIDSAISASVDIHVTLNILLEQVVSELEVDAAAMLLLNPLTRMLEYTVSRGFRAHLVDGMRIQLGAGLAGLAALRRQMQSVSDLRDTLPSQGEPKPAFDVYEGEGFVAHYAKPLVAKGQVQGVLEVYHRSSFQPDDEWFAFLEMLTSQAAIAIDNANLFDKLQRSNTDIVLAYDATIQGWSQALELRDKETEGHAQRVTELTLRLAQLIGIPNTELEHVRRGTLLHDIGKMGIPDSILFKPGKLTEEEWDLMCRHPVYAFELLSSIAYLKPALDIPHYHHERWDGTGYPDGLKGEQIPLYARIFAIVDVYDALTSDRPYRPAWTVEKALEHIREQSGKHFEPRIVETFLALISREK